MIPYYQTLMRPVLQASATGEVRIGEVVDQLADKLALSDDDREELLPSGKQTKSANRVHWAKSYLKQAGLVWATRRGTFHNHGSRARSTCRGRRGNQPHLSRTLS